MVPIGARASAPPARAAARATAGSPAVCIMRVKPVGPSTTGNATGRPSTDQDVSTDATSRRTWGWKVTRSKAAVARRTEVSRSAPPST